MSDGFAFFDIVLLGMVVAFLVLRLRSVLGRRTGHEQQRPNPMAQRQSHPAEEPPELPDNVARFPRRDEESEAEVEAEPQPQSQPGAEGRKDRMPSLEDSLARLRIADPSFEPQSFLEGARKAFEMIVAAFAQGDSANLRPLLSDDVFENFSSAIRARQAARQTLETTLVSLDSASIIEARLEGRTAFVTVKFVSQQINVTLNAANEIVDGDPKQIAVLTDIWTFGRSTRSRDPNWALVQTSNPM